MYWLRKTRAANESFEEEKEVQINHPYDPIGQSNPHTYRTRLANFNTNYGITWLWTHYYRMPLKHFRYLLMKSVFQQHLS